MTLNRLTETPFNEAGIVYVDDLMMTDDKGFRTKDINSSAFEDEGDATAGIIGTADYEVLYSDGYKADGAKDSKKLYTKTLNVSDRGELVRMNYYTVRHADGSEFHFDSILNNSYVMQNEVLDPSLLSVAFDNEELDTFLYNLTMIYGPEISALNAALQADGVEKEMSAEDKSAVVAEAKKEHPDLNMILHKMYDVSKLDKAVVDNLEWTILHHDYLAEGLRLAGADGAEHKDAKGDVFKLDQDTLDFVKGVLFPTEPVFENIAAVEGDAALDAIRTEMELPADPAGAKTYIAELAALDDVNPLTAADWNDPAKVKAYFNSILKAVVAAGGSDDLPINLKGDDHAITEFTVGKTANGKSTYLSDQLNTKESPQKEVKINTGSEKVKGTFLVDKEGAPTGNEAETSNVRKIGKYLESIAVKYGIDLNDGDDLAKLGDVTGNAVAAAPAPATEPAAAAAAPTRVIINFPKPDGVEGFPDEVADAQKKDADGNAVDKIYVKYVFENGELKGLELYKEDKTTPLALEGDADKTKAHSFADMKAYREQFDLTEDHTVDVERVVVLQKFNHLYANADIGFEMSKEDITTEGKAELDKLIKTVRDNEEYFSSADITIKTRGYASFDTAADLNFTLAGKRGEAVAEYLEDNLADDFPNIYFEYYEYDESLRAGANKKTSPIYYQADISKRRTEITATTPEMEVAAAVVTTPVVSSGKLEFTKEISATATVSKTAPTVNFNVKGIQALNIKSISFLSGDGTKLIGASKVINTWTPLPQSDGVGTEVETTMTGETLWSETGPNKGKDTASMIVILKLNNGDLIKVNVKFSKPS